MMYRVVYKNYKDTNHINTHVYRTFVIVFPYINFIIYVVSCGQTFAEEGMSGNTVLLMKFAQRNSNSIIHLACETNL